MVDFPCTLTLSIPFPTPRLALIALQALSVDTELSPLVRRTLSTCGPHSSTFGMPASSSSLPPPPPTSSDVAAGATTTAEEATTTTTSRDSSDETLLKAEYGATTNRMLRVAVNSFIDSLKLVMEVMEKLDVDVVDVGGVGVGGDGGGGNSVVSST